MQNSGKLPRLFLVDVFSLIGNDGYEILKALLQTKDPIQTKELISKSGTPETRFYGIIKSLERYRLVERTVNTDRTVFYKVSPIGEKLYSLSEETLEEIRAAFIGSESLVQEAIETKYKRTISPNGEKQQQKIPHLRSQI